MGIIYKNRKKYSGDRKIEQYSTDEQFTGKYWINGKPIYRKVLQGTLPNTASTPEIGTIANFGTLVSARFIQRGGSFASDGAIYSGTDTSKINIGFVMDTGRVMYKSIVPSYYGYKVDAIIEYTKTTN